MLGREVSTPLDIMYACPEQSKPIPRTQWVWELQERLEVSHRLVRENIKQAMRRQKKYHDRKLSFETFSVEDSVYVFFPVRKVGCTPKFTSHWH